MTTETRKSTDIRRTEIVDAGMRILAIEGARQFTAERLGAMVGITGGSIFRHFDSMEEILDAIVDRIEEIIFAGFPPQADDPLSALRQFFEHRVRAIREHPEISRLLLSENLIPGAHSSAREKRLREMKRRSRQFVIDCLSAASDRGRLDADVGPEEGALVVLGALHAIAHSRPRPGERKDQSQRVAKVWSILERALTAPDHTKPTDAN